MAIVRRIGTIDNYTGRVKSDIGTIINESTQSKILLQEQEKQNKRNISFQNDIVSAKIYGANKIKLLDESLVKCTEYEFLKTLCEVYKDALVVDDTFIQANESTIENFIIGEVKKISEGNIYGMMNKVSKNSEWLKSLTESCKKKAKATMKKVEEKCNEKENNKDEVDIESIFKEVCSDGDNDEDDKVIDMDNKEVSTCIKDKVTKVIADEEQSNEDKKQLIDDLVSSNTDLSENVYLHRVTPQEEHSLFQSIMIHEYKNCLSGIKEGKEIGEYGTLNESTGDIGVNMDYILFDTILEYTKLELFNTVKITNHTTMQLREMATKFAYSTKK